MKLQTKSLKERWEALRVENPKMRIRNAAEKLEVSEMELLITKIGETVTCLKPEFKSILSEIALLGKVMGLTRNEQCVHERKGIYSNPDFSSTHAGLFVNPDIDLRIFISHWTSGFAVEEQTGSTFRKSLQFFGKDGQAIHKIYLLAESNEAAFEALIDKYQTETQNPEQTITRYATSEKEKPDHEIDTQGFQSDWITLKDTHDFFLLLRKYHLTRTQSLRLAPSEHFAKQISKEAIVTMLEEVSEKQIPIMVFVGNKGLIQIHTGEIHKTLWHENWFNILDPEFNMHLDMEQVAQTWIVRKPTQDGEVTSIEVFNKEGESIVQFFGKRKPGIPELETWREVVAKLS